MKNKLLFVALLLACCTGVHAQLRLPHILSDHLVLQRNATIQLWGWGRAGTTVSVTGSWFADTLRVQVDGGGRWKTSVATVDAGGPHQLHFVSGQEKIALQDLLLGDVWLCSGQSNMEWSGEQNLPEIIAELPQASDPHIRLMRVNRNAADTPQEDMAAQWQPLNAQTLKPFSAIGYFIAKTLRKNLDVPIGIIDASWGGTPAEVWTPAFLINNDRDLQNAAAQQTAAAFRPHEPGQLWNSMLYPVKNYRISGAFWYQGESNVSTWSTYDQLMKNLIGAWRLGWNEDFPFYFVQIAPFTYNNKVPMAALLREQQMKTAQTVPHTGMVVVSDLVDNVKDIHPTQKRAVAERLAQIALHDFYAIPAKTDYKSPLYKQHSVKGKTVVIDFDYANDGLMIKGGKLTDIYIAGADKVFYEAQATVKGKQLVVSATQVSQPVAVRFGFSEDAMPNLFNLAGLPVGPFRTDNWSF